MTVRASLTLLAFVLPSAAVAQVDYDLHVAFDNSLSPGAYYYSEGSVVAPSELDLVERQVSRREGTCVTPPNCLRLTWRSRAGGDWRMTLRLTRNYTHREPLRQHAVVLGLSPTGSCTRDASPLHLCHRCAGEGSPPIRLLGSLDALPARKWTRVRLPFTRSPASSNRPRDVTFDPAHLVSITFVQGLDDGAPHTVLIDDMRIGDEPATGDTLPPAAPAGLAARGYERHVELDVAAESPSPTCCTTRSTARSTAVVHADRHPEGGTSGAMRTSSARQAGRPSTGSPPSTRPTTSRRRRQRSPPRLAR